VSAPRALLIVLALLQATGLAEVMRRQSCAAECRDDGCGGDCTPDNDSPTCPCHCPVTPTIGPSTAHVVLAPIPDAVTVTFAPTDRIHASPDPREILHVPRHAV